MSSDDEDFDEAASAGKDKKGMSKGLGLRVQKKLLGMSIKSKGAAKNLIDDRTGEPFHAVDAGFSFPVFALSASCW